MVMHAASLPSNRYVSKSGNDGLNNCSIETSPCLTVTQAIAKANAGDVIKISNGTYTEGSTMLVDKPLIFLTASSLPDVIFLSPSSGPIFSINNAGASFATLKLNGRRTGSSCVVITMGTANLTGVSIYGCSASNGGHVLGRFFNADSGELHVRE